MKKTTELDEDLEYVRQKLFRAIKVPAEYLGYGSGSLGVEEDYFLPKRDVKEKR